MKDEDASANRELTASSESEVGSTNEGSVGSARHPRLQSQAEKGHHALNGLRHLRASHRHALAELRRDMERRRLV